MSKFADNFAISFLNFPWVEKIYFKDWTWNVKEQSGEIVSKLGHSALQNRAPKYLQ